MMHLKLLFQPIIATATTHDCTFNDAFMCVPKPYLNEILSARHQKQPTPRPNCSRQGEKVRGSERKRWTWCSIWLLFPGTLRCGIIIMTVAAKFTTHLTRITLLRGSCTLWTNVLPAADISPLVHKQAKRRNVDRALELNSL